MSDIPYTKGDAQNKDGDSDAQSLPMARQAHLPEAQNPAMGENEKSRRENPASRQQNYLPDKEIKRATVAQAWCAAILTLVAGLQAYITYRQLAEMEKAAVVSRLDQRAWIGIRFVDVGLMKEGSKFSASVTVENSGKTIAKAVSAKFVVVVRHSAVSDPTGIFNSFPAFAEEVQTNSRVIFPGQQTDVPASNEHAMSAKDIQDVKDGNQRVYLVGRITYEDVFGDPHETKVFQEYIRDQDRFGTRPGPHNDAD